MLHKVDMSKSKPAGVFGSVNQEAVVVETAFSPNQGKSLKSPLLNNESHRLFPTICAGRPFPLPIGAFEQHVNVHGQFTASAE